jgi:hypothetical protein
VKKHGRRNYIQSVRQLPDVQGTSETSGVHGHSGTLHHMGGNVLSVEPFIGFIIVYCIFGFMLA